jgi:hypothetical protein
VVSEEYGLGAEMAFRLHEEVDSTDPRWRFFNVPSVDLSGRVGLLILSDRDTDGPDPRVWASSALEAHVARVRHGVAAEAYRLYRVVGASGAQAARLPERQKVTGELGQD